MPLTTSSNYCKGVNHDGLPPYLVELTDDRLFTFEILNSMCLLENYDHLLFFLECQMNKEGALAVPPFDILLVLMTLATVSDHYKEPLLRANDPYNVSRGKTSHRALKVLRFLVRTLKAFDVSKNKRYDLELLRCQFFIIIDSLSSNATWGDNKRRKRRKTKSGVIYMSQAVEVDVHCTSNSVQNPYRSYISCLEQERRIMGNDLFSVKMKHPGEFINMIMWTLSNSLQNDKALYIASHDVWMPLLELLVDLFELRHEFFIRYEISKPQDENFYVQQLSESPLAIFLNLMTLDSSRSGTQFCECIFLQCDYEFDELASDIQVRPVYHGENSLAKTYIPTTTYSKSYKLKRSMFLRRKIIGVYFRLLSEVPTGHRLIKPRTVADDLINQISHSLANFRDIDEFQAFFITDDLSSTLYFLPLLAEDVLKYLYMNYNQKTKEKVGRPFVLSLIESLDNADRFLDECLSLFHGGFFLPAKKQQSNDSLLDIVKADICLLVLFQYLIYLASPGALKANPKLDMFISFVTRNDRRRNRRLSKNYLSKTRQLRPALLKLLDF